MNSYKALERTKETGSNIGLINKGMVPGIIYGKGSEPTKIALENKVPILPVVIAGTGDIWPRGRKFLSSGKAMIKTLEPIDITKHTKDSIDQLTMDTHRKMKKVYEELQIAIQ